MQNNSIAAFMSKYCQYILVEHWRYDTSSHRPIYISMLMHRSSSTFMLIWLKVRINVSKTGDQLLMLFQISLLKRLKIKLNYNNCQIFD